MQYLKSVGISEEKYTYTYVACQSYQLSKDFSVEMADFYRLYVSRFLKSSYDALP